MPEEPLPLTDEERATDKHDQAIQEIAWESSTSVYTPPPPLPHLSSEPVPLPSGKLNGKWVLRDVALLWVLTGLAGFVVGFVGATMRQPLSIAVIGLTNAVIAVLVFCLSGCLVKVNRFRHLGVVALLTWLSSTINILFVTRASIASWLVAAPFIGLMMLLGGGLSLLFVPEPPKPLRETG